MILTCPSCGTQYVVKDGAIPPEGRQVRCAACKHSWHQDPDATAAEPDEAQAAQPETVAAEAAATDEPRDGDEDESLAEATLIEPRSGPELEERAYDEAVIASTEAEQQPAATMDQGAIETAPAEPSEASAPHEDWREPPHDEAAPDMFSPFAASDEATPRRPSGLAVILMIVLAVVVAAALFWFFAPANLKAQLGLGGNSGSPLALVTTHMDRQRLESGNELLTVTGRVINPTTKEQDVPPLQAQLRSRAGKVVYSWTIAPPARSLPAGASASFNSAEVNVPPGGDELTITLGDPRA
jgi:predicted Zn finger-like uncharacterized protein